MKDKIKATYSVSLTRSYTFQEIEDFVKDNILASDDVKTILNQMIIADAINKIRDGGGYFKVIG